MIKVKQSIISGILALNQSCSSVYAWTPIVVRPFLIKRLFAIIVSYGRTTGTKPADKNGRKFNVKRVGNNGTITTSTIILKKVELSYSLDALEVVAKVG